MAVKFKTIGETCPVWDTFEEAWNETEVIWNECIPILKKIRRGGSRGGVRTSQDLWNEWDELNWKNKKKIYRCICLIKGIKYEQQKEIKIFKVTVEDINMLMEEYEKRIFTVEDIKLFPTSPDSINIEINNIEIK